MCVFFLCPSLYKQVVVKKLCGCVYVCVFGFVVIVLFVCFLNIFLFLLLYFPLYRLVISMGKSSFHAT